MRKGIFFSVLTMISGCGAPVMHDATVARRTPVVSEKPQADLATEEALPDIIYLGTSRTGRFAFFDRPATSTIAVSVGDGTASVLPGHVLAEQAVAMFADVEAGFRSNEGAFRPRMVGDSLVLVQDDTSVFVADLEAKGAARARFPKETLGVHRAADGAYTAWTTNRLIVVPVVGERFELPAKMTNGDAPLSYHDQLLSIREDDGFHLVDLKTHEERPLPARTSNIEFDKTTYFAITDAEIEVWNVTDTKPRIHVRASLPYGPYLAGGKFGFTETNENGGASLTIVDIATGKRSTVAAQKASCAGERIVAIENGRVQTDATCDPGCSSIGEVITPYLVSYDVATGAIVAEQPQTNGPDGGSNPYYETLETAKEELARLGLAPDSVVRHEAGDAFLHWNGHVLRELDPSGEVRTKLTGLRKVPAHYGYVAQSIVATAGPSAFVWNRNGDLVWTSDPETR